MTVFTVEEWVAYEGSDVETVTTDEAEALAIHAEDEARGVRDVAYLKEKYPDNPRMWGRDCGREVTCWRLQDGRYVKDETWPGERS